MNKRINRIIVSGLQLELVVFSYDFILDFKIFLPLLSEQLYPFLPQLLNTSIS